MYKLAFFVPDDNLEIVKSALFEAGAGRQGNYEQCCWQTQGRGQFRPINDAAPAIGRVGELQSLDEWRVEMLVEQSVVRQVVASLLRAHPYEEVAYDLIELVDPSSL